MNTIENHPELIDLNDSENQKKLLELKSFLSNRIFGQEHIIPRFSEMLAVGCRGLDDPVRPKASMIFAGPTGVGKTETAELASIYLFGKGKFFSFDMSEYGHMDGFKLLFGDEQGSEGHLETVLKEHTHGVLLFDEMEKAYRPLLLNFLHQLDKGTIRLGKNTRYSLKNFFFIFTTNIGGAEIIQEMSAGMPWDYVLSSMDVLLKKELKPEFLGRFDEVFVFKALSDENQRKIAGKYLEFYTNHYKKLHHEISFDNDIVNFIVLHGYNDTLGARPMKQATLKFISGAINEQMEKGISHVKGMLKRDDRNQRLYISSIN